MNRPSLKIRLFHVWFRLVRPMTLGVRILAQDEKGRILLVRHTYLKGWHLPGGGVEKHETVFEAAAKELLEETGYEANSSMKMISVYANRRASPRDHVVLFHADKIRKVQEFSPNAEIAEAGFFEIEQLPKDVSDAARLRIREVLDLRQFSELW